MTSISDQLEDAYTQILEADSLVNILRSTDGTDVASLEGHLSVCCSIISRLLMNAGSTVETVNRELHEMRGDAS